MTPAEKNPEAESKDDAATKSDLGEKRLRVEEDATAKKVESVEPEQINTTPEVAEVSKEKTEANPTAET